MRLLTKSTAVQYGREGIRANSIHPGPIDTEMIQLVWQDPNRSREETIARTPLGRIGTVEDIAYGALFLASDESSFMTGSELVMDGGVTAHLGRGPAHTSQRNPWKVAAVGWVAFLCDVVQ